VLPVVGSVVLQLLLALVETLSVNLLAVFLVVTILSVLATIHGLFLFGHVGWVTIELS